MSLQADLFAPQPPPGLPEGLRYRPELISSAEERDLAARFETLPFKPFEFRGYTGHRQVVSFGWRYDFGRRSLDAATPIPDFLLPLRETVAAFTGHAPEALAQALISLYEPGAAIGWHRDRPEFGQVAGVSLLAPCRFRFRRANGQGWERRAFEAAPRSAYLLSGASRTDWEHSIPPLEARRYSVTFRTLAQG
ncbi:alpha-ketoglutarate-dependent dioxygenase AlkB [Caulobacter segnis]|uniref:alpha-ketoglutarate-dependent dioxygenase AlkB n=1 Tax=Caulobacter segnis TaxID=88688 RepID=UPI001CC09E92|nr:alpha-ketoglutarate-dependent dioxygenase AlkB [Caulobacter segnis]UAL11093.1 alpha-ketoglutarate-dependent dioxygenase AlkB [Caulobacter segnis]